MPNLTTSLSSQWALPKLLASDQVYGTRPRTTIPLPETAGTSEPGETAQILADVSYYAPGSGFLGDDQGRSPQEGPAPARSEQPLPAIDTYPWVSKETGKLHRAAIRKVAFAELIVSAIAARKDADMRQVTTPFPEQNSKRIEQLYVNRMETAVAEAHAAISELTRALTVDLNEAARRPVPRVLDPVDPKAQIQRDLGKFQSVLHNILRRAESLGLYLNIPKSLPSSNGPAAESRAAMGTDYV